MEKIMLLKKRLKLSQRANGQTIMTIPIEIKKEITTDKKVTATFEKEGHKIIITIEED